MTTQPEALRLADELDNGEWIAHTNQWKEEAAAELRRLHAVNEELLGFLKVIGDTDPVDAKLAPERLPRIARAAIAKAGGAA